MEQRDFSAAILVNKSKEILLQKKGMDYRAPGIWAFFGGGIEKGETPEQALKRELKEELDLEVKDFKFFKSVDYEGYGRKGKGNYFVVPFDSKLSMLKLNEGVGFALLTKSEVTKLEMDKFDKQIAREFFKNVN